MSTDTDETLLIWIKSASAKFIITTATFSVIELLFLFFELNIDHGLDKKVMIRLFVVSWSLLEASNKHRINREKSSLFFI